MPKLRINKALAATGVASRRGAEDLVKAGKVTLNGMPVTDLATQVDPATDRLAVNGKPVQINQTFYYYVYHKPRGEISTLSDEQGRKCVGEVCSRLKGNPRPVGRLDRQSEGLLVLTNDGDLANRLTHPRYGVKKLYKVTVSPELRGPDAEQMISGVKLEDGPARFLGITLIDRDPGRSRLEVTVGEGRNRLIRRVCEALGYKVHRLKRLKMATLSLGRLELGETRRLGAAEIADLRRQVGLKKLGSQEK